MMRRLWRWLFIATIALTMWFGISDGYYGEHDRAAEDFAFVAALLAITNHDFYR